VFESKLRSLDEKFLAEQEEQLRIQTSIVSGKPLFSLDGDENTKSDPKHKIQHTTIDQESLLLKPDDVKESVVLRETLAVNLNKGERKTTGALAKSN